jgi:hypothetical protein
MGCKCVPCDYCNGSGHIWMSEMGKLSRFRCDDLGDLEPCPECRGGIVEKCEECCEAEYDDDFGEIHL